MIIQGHPKTDRWMDGSDSYPSQLPSCIESDVFGSLNVMNQRFSPGTVPCPVQPCPALPCSVQKFPALRTVRNDSQENTLVLPLSKVIVCISICPVWNPSAAAEAGCLSVSFLNIKLDLVIGPCGRMPCGTDHDEIVLEDGIIG